MDKRDRDHLFLNNFTEGPAFLAFKAQDPCDFKGKDIVIAIIFHQKTLPNLCFFLRKQSRFGQGIQ
jgi:hypothetical protein